MNSMSSSLEHSPQQRAARVKHKLLLKRLGLYALTLWAILTLNFLLPRAMPGDPLLAMVDAESDSAIVDEALRLELARYYGLDQPVWKQYLGYLGNLARGDLGRSIHFHTPVADLIAAYLPWTLLLTLPAILLASLASLLLGAQAGWRRNSLLDRGLLVGFLLLDTIPVFVVGALLLMVFSVRLDWLPLSGAHTAFRLYDTPWQAAADVLRHLALPLATLTLSLAGRDFLLMRNSMITVLGEDFMLVARGKGLDTRAQKFRHGMRNAILPVATRFSMQVGMAITGVVLIETLFAYPGMGRLMFNAVAARDYPVLEGCFLVAGLTVLLANLAADLSYSWLDPRTRVD